MVKGRKIPSKNTLNSTLQRYDRQLILYSSSHNKRTKLFAKLYGVRVIMKLVDGREKPYYYDGLLYRWNKDIGLRVSKFNGFRKVNDNLYVFSSELWYGEGIGDKIINMLRDIGIGHIENIYDGPMVEDREFADLPVKLRRRHKIVEKGDVFEESKYEGRPRRSFR